MARTIKIKRGHTVKGDVTEIHLTQGETCLIDTADLHLVEHFNWCLLRARRGDHGYAVRTRALPAGSTPKARIVWIHRQILGLPERMSMPTPIEVDHINNDGLDCRRINMRLATQFQNARNTALRRNNTSGFKGVSWRKRSQKWRAAIRADGRWISIGEYVDPLEAHAAYCKASLRYHGEFGKTE